MIILKGLLSITFRKKSPEEIIELVKSSGLQAIEWGGDIHVPHGDIEAARKTALLTKEAGLEVACYGSYYRAGKVEDEHAFQPVLDSALALGAPAIRVWAGDRSSADADSAWWNKVITDLQHIADLANEHQLQIVIEYHKNTLTDSWQTAVQLIESVDRSNVKMNWQPPTELSISERMEGLERVAPWLAHVHVFQWSEQGRHPLSDGEAEWTEYLRFIDQLPTGHPVMLEFVKDDDEAQFLADASTLLKICDL